MNIKKVRVDFDYSKYLGQGYLKTQKVPQSPSCFCVAGHTSWMDAVALVRHYQSNFITKKSLRKVPILGTVLISMGNIFVDRAATTEIEKDQMLKDIEEAQTHIENQIGDLQCFTIFPEGGNSNNSYIIPFKKGAFVSNKSVLPIALKYTSNEMHPAIHYKNVFQQLVFMYCLIG